MINEMKFSNYLYFIKLYSTDPVTNSKPTAGLPLRDLLLGHFTIEGLMNRLQSAKYGKKT